MRKIQINNDSVEPCPECGNKKVFNIHSTRGGEDFMEVYAECSECGFTHNHLDRYESVWGGTNKQNCIMAIRCWNEAVVEIANQ